MSKGLTKRQQNILDFLVSYTREKGYPPTIREIGGHFGIRSTNGVNDHLLALERKKCIRREKGAYRALEIAGLKRGMPAGGRAVPLVGQVAAGQPILAEEHVEDTLTLDEQFWRGRADFALRVTGDSMKDAGILNGDVCLVRQQAVAEQGEIIVAMVDGDATVKRFYPTPEGIRLKAENPAFKDLFIPRTDPFQVLGKVVGVIRNID